MAEKSSREARKSAQFTQILLKEQEQCIIRQLRKILKKETWERTEDEKVMLQHYPEAVVDLQQKKKKQVQAQERLQEIADPTDELDHKCAQLAESIKSASSVVVYTGAGISTAAEIPDYRGPMGIWTLLKKGQEVRVHDLSQAVPTYSHMAISELHRRNLVHHVVSQNCDGLHLRSGLPQTALSEVHGNMFIEVCSKCKPVHQFFRLFDVTEQTSLHRHKTGRKCPKCRSDLLDTIVHFGERGKLRWPLNWKGAGKAADKCDLIICLGTSLKVLKKYQCLWCLDKPLKDRPDLYVVNLQWTPKDDQATLKVNGKCDDVMKKVMDFLNIEVPTYSRITDPLFELAIPLTPKEESTCSTNVLVPPEGSAAATGRNSFLAPRRSPRLLALLNQVLADHTYAQCNGVLQDVNYRTDDKEKDDISDSEEPITKRIKEDIESVEEQDEVSNCNKMAGWFGKGYQKGRKAKTKRLLLSRA